MSLFYHIAYHLGITPWENAAETHGHLIQALLEKEKNERDQPYGSALDLGCGTGFWTVELAKQGWNVTGIDNVPKALRKARKRAKENDLEIHFIQGDVTALRDAAVGSDFQFFLDLGCFHGLNEKQRIAMGQEVHAMAAPNATLLELVWSPANRGPLPHGASPDDLERAFINWKIVDEEPLDATALPSFLKDSDPRCYKLRHVA